MKKAIFLGLISILWFVGCSKMPPTSVKENNNPNVAMREDDDLYFGVEVIDFHRNRTDGTFYEIPPEGYTFSKEGIFNYVEVFLFIDNEQNVTELYRFADVADIPTYEETEGQVAYRANRMGHQNYPTTPCPTSGINCGRDGSGAYYLFIL